MADITEVLQQVADGDQKQADNLFELVYPDLLKVAARLLRRERYGHTVEPTSLVHEAYLRLVDQKHADWKSRSHFVAIGARVMRRILVDHARQRASLKRGGGMLLISFSEELARTFSMGRDHDVLVFDEILTKLEESDARQAKIVELRFFGGLTLDEVAVTLRVSRRTVAYEWRAVRAWMRTELSRPVGSNPPPDPCTTPAL